MDIPFAIQTLYSGALHASLPFLMCVGVLALLHGLAPGWRLLDLPGDLKHHAGQVPLTGGIAMFAGIAGAALLLNFHYDVLVFLGLGAVLIALGVIDDRCDIPVLWRLVIQATVAAAMVAFADVRITGLGDLIGIGPVELHGVVALAFTILCTVGVINAVNMIDGMDGLAGSILLISFTGLGALSFANGNMLGAKMLVIFSGALGGFLCFNARVFVLRARAFMGDSGSMLMGFILAWFCITMTQAEEPAMSAAVAGWLFGLPLLDTLSVTVRRIANGRSPWLGARDHLHHRLLDSGLSVNRTVLAMGSLHALLVLAGVTAELRGVAEAPLFFGFVSLVLLHHYGTPRLLERVRGEAAISRS